MVGGRRVLRTAEAEAHAPARLDTHRTLAAAAAPAAAAAASTRVRVVFRQCQRLHLLLRRRLLLRRPSNDGALCTIGGVRS